MSHSTEPTIGLDRDILLSLKDLDDAVKLAISLLGGYEPPQDRLWMRTARYFLKLSEEVIPLDRHPPNSATMKEAHFRRLYTLGKELFQDSRKLPHNRFLRNTVQDLKYRTLPAWEQIDAQAKSLLPASQTAKPADAIIGDVKATRLTYESLKETLTAEEVGDIHSCLTDFTRTLSVHTGGTGGSGDDIEGFVYVK